MSNGFDTADVAEFSEFVDTYTVSRPGTPAQEYNLRASIDEWRWMRGEMHFLPQEARLVHPEYWSMLGKLKDYEDQVREHARKDPGAFVRILGELTADRRPERFSIAALLPEVSGDVPLGVPGLDG